MESRLALIAAAAAAAAAAGVITTLTLRGVSAGSDDTPKYAQNSKLDGKALKEAALRGFVESWVQGGSYPCLAVSVLQGRRVADPSSDNLDASLLKVKEEFFHVTGLQDVENKVPCDRNTIYRIYSMTKPITTVAALILMERGQMDLDDPVYKYIPSFEHMSVLTGGTVHAPETEPLNEHITIRHLMSHSSGMTYGLFGNTVSDKLFQSDSAFKQGWFKMPLSELCDLVASIPLLFQPGTKFCYGLNTDVLGHIIELVSGVSLDAFFKQEIFNPLGMHDTGFIVPAKDLSRLAQCYTYANGHGLKLSDTPERNRSTPRPLLSGGGGLVSTMDDYSRFASMLLRGGISAEGVRLLKAGTVREMHTNQLPGNGTVLELSFNKAFSEGTGPAMGFGLGVAVVLDPSTARGACHSSVGEFGWGGVASTFFCVDPVNLSVIIAMTQLTPSSSYPIRHQLRWLGHQLLLHDDDVLSTAKEEVIALQERTF